MKYILAIYFSLVLFSANAQISDFNHIDFTKAENLVSINKGKNLDNLPLLTFQLTHKVSTDVEKFRAIYRWVCENISGDSYQHNLVSRKREKLKNDSLGYLKWNSRFKKEAFKKLLKQKKTMCTGYAYIIKEMCFLANIECKIVDGYARSFDANVFSLNSYNHSWNVVKLNDKWYLCDATWSSGYMVNGNLFVKDYNDGYFLTDPRLFAKNHFPLEKKWFLNDSISKQKFKPEPIVYGETFDHQIIPISPYKLETKIEKKATVLFKVKHLKDIADKKISLVQYAGTNERKFKIQDLKSTDDNLSFSYQFKYKGSYDVHLKIDNDIVATYVIKVVKSEPN